MAPKKKAAQAAQAASKKRIAAIDISAKHEERVRSALKELGIGSGGSAPAPAAAAAQPAPKTAAAAQLPLPREDALQRVVAAYAALQAQGFRKEQVEQALEALPLEALSQEAALDWLLLHLEQEQLPRRFQGQGGLRSRGGAVDVRLRAAEGASGGKGTQQQQQQEGPGWQEQQRLAEQEAQERARQERQRAEAERREQQAAEEREKASRRAWIMQYMDNSSESGSESGSEQESEGSVIEDWEVWGDPREVERRRAERKRSSLLREARLELIARELEQAKEEASRSKAARDKGRQRAAGDMIRQLKQEMEAMGVTEADLPLTAGASATNEEASASAGEAIAAGGGAGAAAQPSEAQPAEGAAAQGGWEGDAQEEFGLWDDEGQGQSGRPSAGDEVEGEEGETTKSAAHAASESGSDLGGNLFDDDFISALEPSEPSSGKKKRREAAAAAAAAAAAQPWGSQASTGGSGGKKGGKKGKGSPPPPELQQPKAILQQYCQREGWPAPRYERLAQGGMRLEGGGYRYAVSVEPAAKGPRRKGQQAQQGPCTFQLPEDEDGWERIEDAQNAAAARALYELKAQLPAGGPVAGSAQLVLPPLFKELWAQWEEDAEEGKAWADMEAEADEAARLEFAKRLVSKHQAELEAAKQSEAAGAGMDPELEAAEQSWAEQLRQELAASGGRDAERAQRESAAMLGELKQWQESGEGAKWQEERGRLPVVAIREGLVAALAQHDVVVVSGETGSGKTTQVPQYILEDAVLRGQGGSCSIVCTQPRRIAAISVAERVAAERGEPAPGQPGARVGYHVRLDAAQTSSTRLLFCTTGILLRRLAGDPALRQVSHVLVDEVHERTLQGDFLMALLRELVSVRRAAGLPLKVVLMSATLDSSLYADYFGGGAAGAAGTAAAAAAAAGAGGGGGGGCPVLHAQGRTFPVEQLFLEDAYELTGYRLDAESPAALRPQWDRRAQQRVAKTAGAGKQSLVRSGWGDAEADAGVLNPNYQEELYEDYSAHTRRNLARVDEDRLDYDLLEDLLAHIDGEKEEGAILVFLPGMGEITSLYERLSGSRRFRSGSHWLIPLHSTVSPNEQRQAFKQPPPGVRKIVLATNIAETSLTIEDVVYVVDSGKLKERRYDASRGMSLLVEDWVSVASAKQRRGRAGRVRPGVCYGLYTRQRFDERLRKYQAPEMVRVPLEELVLQIHLLRLGHAGPFLSRVLQPPPDKSVAGAVRVLQEVGALTPAEELTPLGHHLAQLPVDARVGKLLLLSASLGCLAPALTVAACLSYKSPFSSSFAQQDAADRARRALAAPGSGSVAAGQQSDHLLMVAAVDGWLAARKEGGPPAGRQYSRKHFLSEATLDMLADMRQQFASMLADIGFIGTGGGGGSGSSRPRGKGWVDDKSALWNRYASSPAVVKAVLFAALYPNVAVMDDESVQGKRPGWHDGIGEVAIHPSSINHPLETQQFHRPYLTYLEKVRTSKTFLRDCTTISPMAILFFGGPLRVVHEGGYVTVDGWIRIRAPAQTAVLVKQLRAALESLLEQKVRKPRLALEEVGGQVIQSIVDLLNHEEAAREWGVR